MCCKQLSIEIKERQYLDSIIKSNLDIIKKAPKKLLASGCGDLMAKVTAVHDWELGRDKIGEYYG